MNENEINDIRKPQDFKTITFSNYSRSKVKTELIKSIHNNNIEPACYWSVELICAGHFNDLWNCIISYTSRYIHIANPKLPIYLSRRFNSFKNIVNNGYRENEILMRNNPEIRKLFAEIITIISTSRKNHCFENYAIKNIDEFDITNITTRLKATSIEFANQIFTNKDPKEIFIAINEFIYDISSDNKDNISACYWIEWILKFEIISKQKKSQLNCERRSFAPVEEKYQMNIIWMIWEGLIIESKSKDTNIKNTIDSLLELFCIRYKPSNNRSRKYLIYWAVCFLTQDINFKNPLIKNSEIIKNISNNIDLIYKQIKQNEKKPSTDYLFNGLNENNIEKSMKKLETMNTFLNID